MFDRGLLVAVAEQVTDWILHNLLGDRTHVIFGNVLNEGLVIVIAGVGSGGDSGGNGNV